MRKWTLPILPVLLAAVITGVFLPATPAHAQAKVSADRKDQEIELLKSEVRQLEQRVETLEGLDQKVKVIDRKLEVQAETEKVQAEIQKKKVLEMPIVKTSDEGFTFSSPTKQAGDQPDYKVKLGANVQANGRFFMSGADKNISSTFYLNKIRPILSGTLGKYYDFLIMPDFGQGRVLVQDAWVNINYFKEAQFQGGKYKAPVNMERLQPDPYTEFVQRSEVQNLVPNRDTGAEFHGDLFDNRLTYQIALMNGVPNNTATTDIDTNDGKDFMGRVFLTPWKHSENEWLKGFGVGFGGTYGTERGTTTSVYKTWGQSTWFSYNKGVTASGLRTHLDPQVYYYWRHLGLMAEYAQDEHSLNLFTKTGTAPFVKLVNRTDTFTDTGYMAQASYYLTGENAAYGWVKPLRPFDPRHGGWGGWELAARISNNAAQTRQFQLGFASPNVSAKAATEFALGINWYLSNNVRWWFDYANTYFDGGAGTAKVPKDRPNESVFESQLQIAF
jgi:phosphate-selective porin OprO/OprP